MHPSNGNGRLPKTERKMRNYYATHKLWNYYKDILYTIPENLFSPGFFFGWVSRNNPHASFCFFMSKTRNKTVGVT